jgi:transposase
MTSTKYIGLDVHKESISIAVRNAAGKVVMECVIETKASMILQFIDGLRGDLQITFEEGTSAAWLYDLLKPHVTKLVVCDPRKNKSMREGNQSDKIDARRLDFITNNSMRCECFGRRNSGESEPQKKISKEGDRYLRTMMVQGAHYILGPFGEDSDLRRWGMKLAERGGKNAKKRAVVAVARKLAVLLHRLWVSGEVYEPLRNSQKAMRAVA